MTTDTPTPPRDPLDATLELAGRIRDLAPDPDRRAGESLLHLLLEAIDPAIVPLYRRIGDLAGRVDELEAGSANLAQLADSLGDRGELVLRRRVDR